MRWTLRLKRHGGMTGLMHKRADHYKLLSHAGLVSRDEFIPAAVVFLNGNPLRVLSTEAVAYFQNLLPETTRDEQPLETRSDRSDD